MTRAIHFNHITPALSIYTYIYLCFSDGFIIIIVRAHICTMYTQCIEFNFHAITHETFAACRLFQFNKCISTLNLTMVNIEQWEHSMEWKSLETRLSNPLIELPETVKMFSYIIWFVNLFGQQLKSFSNHATGWIFTYLCVFDKEWWIFQIQPIN